MCTMEKSICLYYINSTGKLSYETRLKVEFLRLYNAG